MSRGLLRPKLLVIADDLTGANDAGAQFAKFGIVVIVLARPDAAFPCDGFEVVVVNTESRHVPAGEAAARVRQAIEVARQAGAEWVFKKTDSTLRGNLGAELEAVLDATGARVLPFIAALPQLGRTTIGGVHYVHGRPIAETEFARDPLNPIRQSEVVSVLREQANGPCVSVPKAQDVSAQNGLCIIDCATVGELEGIVDQLAVTGHLGVLAGSAVVAEPLARKLPLRRAEPNPLRLDGPALVVNGSLNERSLDQVRYAPGGRLVKLRLHPEHLFREPGGPVLPDLVERAMASRSNVLLHTIADRSELAGFADSARLFGIPADELHGRVAEALGRITREALRSGGAGRTLIVFGGDTLAGIARASGWNLFVPRGEVSPGLTISQPAGEKLTVISKAGGFGESDVVDRLLDFVENRLRADPS